MSKVTFRADDALVDRLDRLDASKSEVMREALREYLDRHQGSADEAAPEVTDDAPAGTLDEAVAARVDELLAERLDRSGVGAPARGTQDINLDVHVHGADDAAVESSPAPGSTERDEPAAEASSTCGQCGEAMDDDHVYCPNCGEKATHRAFCECGDEVRTDWAFCPSCGRRTPAADVLERS